MTLDRYNELMDDQMSELTESEIKEGWHFCVEWDGLLVGPGMGELHFCECEVAKNVPRPPVESAGPAEKPELVF